MEIYVLIYREHGRIAEVKTFSDMDGAIVAMENMGFGREEIDAVIDHDHYSDHCGTEIDMRITGLDD